MKKQHNKYFKIVITIAIAIMSIGIIGCKSKVDLVNLTTKEKLEDFQYMYNVILESYPYLEVNKRVNNIDWVANKDIYIEKIENTKNDEEFIEALKSILSDLNNGHTHLIDNLSLFEFFKDGYMIEGLYDFWEDSKVINRYNSLETVENSKIVSTEDIILKDVIAGEVGYIYLPQMMARGESIEADMGRISEYVQTLKKHDAIIIDVRGNTGGSDFYWSNLLSMIIPKVYKTSGYILFRESDLISTYINNRGIKVKNIEELPIEILENAPEEVRCDFNYFVSNDSNIVINNSIKFEGEIFLLIDKAVYSASESFSIFCKEGGLATLIGETTSGDGGGVDPVLFKLENSGLIIRMASDMYLTESGVCNEEFKTTPDYIIENPKRTENFNDDNCIKKVLELMEY